MNDFFDLMLAPLVACLILGGIHAYLGIHVVKRGVIFVDLALAQLAAFGSTLGFLFGWGLHSFKGYVVALGFTLVGAAIFSLTRLRAQRVPHEALIGIVYAVAAAASVLVLSCAPDGGEELKSLMVGHLLYVSWGEVATIAALYIPLGILHWVLRAPLLEISEDAERAFAAGRRVRLWDFFFYATFGAIVTGSTELAGVLLVFSFLVVPAVCGVLLADGATQRLLVGWASSFVTCIAGITLSYFGDLPTGATIVCMFGATLIFCALLALRRRA